ncbi:DUF222 domain-containing protein [Rhodococcus sp. NPDC003322]
MELDEMLTAPHGVEAWRLDEKTLLELVPELSARMRQLDALRVRLVHEIDERCVAQTVGASSTQAWLSGTCKLTPGHAKKIITAGRSLRNRPDVADAFTAGTVDVDQVRAITNLLDQIPDLLSDVDPVVVDGELVDPVAECTQQCTDYLVAAAEHEHSADTANRATALKTMLERDNDGPPSDDENEALNEFFASPTAAGRVRVKGHFDKTTGEQLLTALSALSKPQPGRNNTHGEPDQDPRTAPQRRADAFADIVRHYFDSGDAPGEGGEKPHMTVFVGLNDLANATRTTTDAGTPTTNTVTVTVACTDTDTDTSTRTGIGTRGTSNARSTLCDRSENQCGPGDCYGTCGSDGCPVAQAVANAAEPGRSYIRRGPAWMPWLGPISIRLAAMLSCDASVTPIAMDDDGNPLDVGTTTRVIPRRIRRALDARDCGCAFLPQALRAGGTPRLRPPGRLDRRPPSPKHFVQGGAPIHHWSNGGPTKLSNLVLLCRFHHGLIHKGEWEVFVSTDDGHPWFVPPRWMDPQRRPVPAHNRRELIFTS